MILAGATGGLSASALGVEVPFTERVISTTADAAYVFVRDGGGLWSQQAYIKASNTGADDEFGWSVAVSGDTVVIGAQWEDSNTTGVNGSEADDSAGDSGAAYVFVRDAGGVWSQQAYLKAPNTGADDRFGFSVGMSGDTVVVGAVFEDSNATGVNGNQADNIALMSGASYIFLVTLCGDGAIEGDEQCDDGDANSDTVPDACRTNCTLAICGDGVVDTDEACDDGNTNNTDACFSTCQINPNPIPAVSEWGLIITLLLVLAGGTILIDRRRATDQTACT